MSNYGCPDNWQEVNIALCTEEVWDNLFSQLKEGEYRILSSTTKVTKEGIIVIHGSAMFSPRIMKQLEVL